MVLRKFLFLIASLSCSLFVADTLVAQRNSSSAGLFPMPDVIKPNVEFWKNIYGKYSESEIVIHDNEDLDIVYEVVNLNTLFKGVEVSHRLQWKKIELIKKNYKSILMKLSNRRNLNPDALNGKDRDVALLFGKDLNSTRLRRAAKNIRAQNGLKERFRLGVERSGLYMKKMEEIFSEARLPLELLALPHVESSFNHRAYSKFGAAGMWQFTRSTGRMFMKIDYTIDERLDPIIATESAAELITRNYRELQSWPLAITAYNHGLYGMKRAKSSFGDDIATIVRNYKSRSFGFASRNFYSEFLAALHVSTNYRHYFGEVQFHKPQDHLVFETPDFISVAALLKHVDISVDEFAELNPALRTPVLKSARRIPRNFRIRIPLRENLKMTEVYAKISSELKFDEQVRPEWHKVSAGEGLSVISQRYRVSMTELMELNNIHNPHLIYVGQNLQIPTSSSRASAPKVAVRIEEGRQLAEATDLNKGDQKSVTDVPRGIAIRQPTESISTELAEASHRSADARPATPDVEMIQVKQASAPVPSSKKQLDAIQVEELKTEIASLEDEMAMALPDHYVELTKDMQTRVVRRPHSDLHPNPARQLAFPQNGKVRVEPEETLGHFADWLSVPTHRIRAVNRFGYDQPIRVGQPLLLTFEKVTPEEFHRRRLEYHQGIEEDFYRNFTVEGENTYKVRAGENIWYLCLQVFDMPYWLVMKHNPDRDLMHLKVGEELIIPIVERKIASD